MNEAISKLSAAQLRRAAEIKEQIEALQSQMERVMAGEAVTPVAARKRRQISAAGRARIAAAQRARWALFKAKV